MATQTYKYWKADPNLRAAYGGAAIVDNGDSQEVDLTSLAARHYLKQLDYIDSGIDNICEIGNDGTDDWFKMSDNHYSGISSQLSTAELATVVSSAPAGYSTSSKRPVMTSRANRTNIIVRGDSISDGLGTTSGDSLDTVWGQAIEDLDSSTLVYSDSNNVGVGHDYAWVNMSIGGGSWANTGAGGAATYPQREDLAYNQRTKTHPLDNGIFIYWLGTNDLSYDGTLSGADCWARAAARIATLAADFPNMKIIIASMIKRGTSSPFHTRADDYNTAMRAGYIAAGAHVLCDFEDDVSQVNISTGDTTDTNNYTDTVHLTTAGQTLLVPTAKTAINAAVALLP